MSTYDIEDVDDEYIDGDNYLFKTCKNLRKWCDNLAFW